MKFRRFWRIYFLYSRRSYRFYQVWILIRHSLFLLPRSILMEIFIELRCYLLYFVFVQSPGGISCDLTVSCKRITQAFIFIFQPRTIDGFQFFLRISQIFRIRLLSHFVGIRQFACIMWSTIDRGIKILFTDLWLDV